MSPPSPDHGLWHLLVCASGICICYLSYGLVFEKLFTGKDRLGAIFVLVTQSVTNSLVAYVWKQQKTPSGIKESSSQHKLPLRHAVIFFSSACYVGAMACSNEAIQYVSYPVTAVFKSCKLIPTMLVGQLVEGRLHSATEWLAALLITCGILLFQWSRLQNASSQPGTGNDDDAANGHQTYGTLLLLGSLSLDGVLAACQNVIKRPSPNESYRVPTAIETMLYMNVYAVFYLVPLSIWTGQWSHGLERMQANPGDYLLQLGLLNTTVAAGQIFIFLTIQWYSPVVTTTITTTRKFFTILLSVWMYGHSFSVTQWLAVCLVFSGLYLAILMVQRKRSAKQKAE